MLEEENVQEGAAENVGDSVGEDSEVEDTRVNGHENIGDNDEDDKEVEDINVSSHQEGTEDGPEFQERKSVVLAKEAALSEQQYDFEEEHARADEAVKVEAEAARLEETHSLAGGTEREWNAGLEKLGDACKGIIMSPFSAGLNSDEDASPGTEYANDLVQGAMSETQLAYRDWDSQLEESPEKTQLVNTSRRSLDVSNDQIMLSDPFVTSEQEEEPSEIPALTAPYPVDRSTLDVSARLEGSASQCLLAKSPSCDNNASVPPPDSAAKWKNAARCREVPDSQCEDAEEGNSPERILPPTLPCNGDGSVLEVGESQFPILPDAETETEPYDKPSPNKPGLASLLAGSMRQGVDPFMTMASAWDDHVQEEEPPKQIVSIDEDPGSEGTALERRSASPLRDSTPLVVVSPSQSQEKSQRQELVPLFRAPMRPLSQDKSEGSPMEQPRNSKLGDSQWLGSEFPCTEIAPNSLAAIREDSAVAPEASLAVAETSNDVQEPTLAVADASTVIRVSSLGADMYDTETQVITSQTQITQTLSPTKPVIEKTIKALPSKSSEEVRIIPQDAREVDSVTEGSQNDNLGIDRMAQFAGTFLTGRSGKVVQFSTAQLSKASVALEDEVSETTESLCQKRTIGKTGFAVHGNKPKAFKRPRVMPSCVTGAPTVQSRVRKPPLPTAEKNEMKPTDSRVAMPPPQVQPPTAFRAFGDGGLGSGMIVVTPENEKGSPRTREKSISMEVIETVKATSPMAVPSQSRSASRAASEAFSPSSSENDLFRGMVVFITRLGITKAKYGISVKNVEKRGGKVTSCLSVNPRTTHLVTNKPYTDTLRELKIPDFPTGVVVVKLPWIETVVLRKERVHIAPYLVEPEEKDPTGVIFDTPSRSRSLEDTPNSKLGSRRRTPSECLLRKSPGGSHTATPVGSQSRRNAWVTPKQEMQPNGGILVRVDGQSSFVRLVIYNPKKRQLCVRLKSGSQYWLRPVEQEQFEHLISGECEFSNTISAWLRPDGSPFQISKEPFG